MNEGSQEFEASLCLPKDRQPYLDNEVETLIDSGIFTMALRENRPIIVYSSDLAQRLVIHVLATSSRTRGMFVGILDANEPIVSGLILSLLSIILKNCSNAVESFELYRLFRSSENEAAGVLDSLPLPAFTLDQDGGIIQANSAFRNCLRIPESCSLPGFYDLLPPGEDQAIRQHLDSLAIDGDCQPQPFTVRATGARFLLFARIASPGGREKFRCQAAPTF